MRKCTGCNSEIVDDKLTACPMCGKPLKKKGLPTVAIVLIVIVAVGVGLISFLGIIGLTAAMTIPTLMTNIDIAKSRSLFKKEVSTINQAILMYQAQNDLDKVIHTDDLWNGIKSNLYGATDNGDNINLADGSNLSYQKLKNNCTLFTNDKFVANACAIITIDTNGLNSPPNEFTTNDKIKDKFKVYLLGDTVVFGEGSPEETIITKAYQDR